MCPASACGPDSTTRPRVRSPSWSDPAGPARPWASAGGCAHTGRAETTAWVRADATWTPARLLAVLDSVTRMRRRPPLVVVDDAHQLPLPTVRALDAPPRHRPRLVPGAAGLALGPAAHPARPRAARPPHHAARRAAAARRGASRRRWSRRTRAPTPPRSLGAIAGSAPRAGAPRSCSPRAPSAPPPTRSRSPAATPRAAPSVADRVASEVFADPPTRASGTCCSASPTSRSSPRRSPCTSPTTRARATVLADLEAMGLLVTRVSA